MILQQLVSSNKSKNNCIENKSHKPNEKLASEIRHVNQPSGKRKIKTMHRYLGIYLAEEPNQVIYIL